MSRSTVFVSLLTIAVSLGALTRTARAVNGITYATARSAESSASTRFVEAACPAGTRPLGGSAVIAGPASIVINAAVPTLTGFEVFASEPAGGVTENWYIVANAICVPPGALAGFERKEIFSSFDSASSHSASLSCSPGMILIGVGGLIDSNGPGQDRLVLTTVQPSEDLRTLLVLGHEAEGGYESNWRVKAVGLCASPQSGQQRIRATTAVDASDHKLVRAACPAGTKIHSTGFDLTSGLGQVHATTYIFDVDLNSDPNVQGVEVQAREDANGFLSVTRAGIDGGIFVNDKWSASALGICAR
jgi:hypothetical protein